MVTVHHIVYLYYATAYMYITIRCSLTGNYGERSESMSYDNLFVGSLNPTPSAGRLYALSPAFLASLSILWYHILSQMFESKIWKTIMDDSIESVVASALFPNSISYCCVYFMGNTTYGIVKSYLLTFSAIDFLVPVATCALAMLDKFHFLNRYKLTRNTLFIAYLALNIVSLHLVLNQPQTCTDSSITTTIKTMYPVIKLLIGFLSILSTLIQTFKIIEHAYNRRLEFNNYSVDDIRLVTFLLYLVMCYAYWVAPIEVDGFYFTSFKTILGDIVPTPIFALAYEDKMLFFRGLHLGSFTVIGIHHAILNLLLKSEHEEVERRSNEEYSNLEIKLKEKREGNIRRVLSQMLPPSIVLKLENGIPITPEWFEHSSVFFSDIEGYTEQSSQMHPINILAYLHKLYSIMDHVLQCYFPTLYKVETIGDSYMVCGGAPYRDKNHAKNIADFAIIISRVTMNLPSLSGNGTTRLRIGIHTGPVLGGVVGSKMPRFCLFGDTVNTTSRIESTGEVGKIHISREMMRKLKGDKAYVIQYRGVTSLKGKRPRHTYWLDVRLLYLKYPVEKIIEVTDALAAELTKKALGLNKLITKFNQSPEARADDDVHNTSSGGSSESRYTLSDLDALDRAASTSKSSSEISRSMSTSDIEITPEPPQSTMAENISHSRSESQFRREPNRVSFINPTDLDNDTNIRRICSHNSLHSMNSCPSDNNLDSVLDNVIEKVNMEQLDSYQQEIELNDNGDYLKNNIPELLRDRKSRYDLIINSLISTADTLPVFDFGTLVPNIAGTPTNTASRKVNTNKMRSDYLSESLSSSQTSRDILDLATPLSTAGDFSDFSVLIVDDSITTVRFHKKIIQSIRPNCDIYTAANGLECIQFVDEVIMYHRRLDLIIIDDKMPALSGRQCINQLIDLGYKGYFVGVIGDIDTIREFNEETNNTALLVLPKPLNVQVIEKVFQLLDEAL